MEREKCQRRRARWIWLDWLVKASARLPPLVRNLPNQQHTLELVTNGAGEVTIEALYVHEPPEK